MLKPFNKTFFRFLLGFVAIIAISFVVIVSAGMYSNRDNISAVNTGTNTYLKSVQSSSQNLGALGQMSALLYSIFIK